MKIQEERRFAALVGMWCRVEVIGENEFNHPFTSHEGDVMHDAIIRAVGQTPSINKMRLLHVMAFLHQMELLAEQNKINSLKI